LQLLKVWEGQMALFVNIFCFILFFFLFEYCVMMWHKGKNIFVFELFVSVFVLRREKKRRQKTNFLTNRDNIQIGKSLRGINVVFFSFFSLPQWNTRPYERHSKCRRIQPEEIDTTSLQRDLELYPQIWEFLFLLSIFILHRRTYRER
jgi:hypothetical protein